MAPAISCGSVASLCIKTGLAVRGSWHSCRLKSMAFWRSGFSLSGSCLKAMASGRAMGSRGGFSELGIRVLVLRQIQGQTLFDQPEHVSMTTSKASQKAWSSVLLEPD